MDELPPGPQQVPRSGSPKAPSRSPVAPAAPWAVWERPPGSPPDPRSPQPAGDPGWVSPRPGGAGLVLGHRTQCWSRGRARRSGSCAGRASSTAPCAQGWECCWQLGWQRGRPHVQGCAGSWAQNTPVLQAQSCRDHTGKALTLLWLWMHDKSRFVTET